MNLRACTFAVVLLLGLEVKASDVVFPPVASCPSAARYPDAALASGLQGKVLLRLHISVSGALGAVEVAEPMGSPFDEAAEVAARACTFTPARRGDAPVESVVELGIAFDPPVPHAQLEGVVRNGVGQPLAGATVTVTAHELVLTTDVNGHFAIDLELPEAEDVRVRVEAPELQPQTFLVHLSPGEHRAVKAVLHRGRMLETVITEHRGTTLLPTLPKPDETPRVSHFTVRSIDIDRTPGALEDITRVVQDLPGVVGDPDLLATFSVRGGGPDEVLFFLDGIPLPSAFHLGGFLSLFDPQLMTSADFYAGGAPARYEPGLSAVLDVHYDDAVAKKFRALLDVSMESIKGRVDVPLADGLSVTLSARRSYFELYFLLLKAFRIAGENYAAPNINEYTARLNFTRGRHRLTATLLYAQDGLNFEVKPGEQLLVNFEGGLSLRNQFSLGSIKDRVDLGAGNELAGTLAFSRDLNHSSVASDVTYVEDARRDNVFAGLELGLHHRAQNQSRLGLQYQRWDQRYSGELPDTRAVAPWETQPFVASDLALLPVQPRVLRNLLAVFAEHAYQPLHFLTLEGSARLERDVTRGNWTNALRLAAAVTLPTHTIAKLSFSTARQLRMDALLLDPTYGNPNLAPEQATHLVAGLEQPLPFHALARLEAYQKWMSQLAVNPDSQAGVAARETAGKPVVASLGHGQAQGLDGMLLGQTGRVSYGVALSLVKATRDNPLASAFPAEYRAPWDQRFSTSVHVSYQPDEHWVFSGRGAFHTGRPYTQVEGFHFDAAKGKWLPEFGAPNAGQYPAFFEASLRAERHWNWGPVSAAWYVEVLNVSNTRNVFAYLYDSGSASAAGPKPQRSSFDQLPIRPFLGIRAEY